MGLFRRTGKSDDFQVSFDARPQEQFPGLAHSTVDAVIQTYARTFGASKDPVTITDRDGIIRYVNAPFTEMTGYTAAEALGKTPRILKSGKHNGFFYQNMWHVLMSGNVWRGRMTNRKKDGTFYVDEKVITPIIGSGGAIECFIAVRRDATAQVNAEREQTRLQEEQMLPLQLRSIAEEAQTSSDLLKRAVDVFLSLQEFGTGSGGVAFELLHDLNVLKLVVATGTFSRQFMEDEATIQLGACLCGRAAVEGRVLVCSNCYTDPRHEHRWLGMKAHGHYTIPVRTQTRVWGIVNMYTDTDVDTSDHRLSLMASAGFQLGAAMEQLCQARSS